MALVAVTGATGFIGRATCRALIDSGIDVRALVRTVPARGIIPPPVTTIVTGDLTAAADLERSVSACDAVIHLAARVPTRPDRSIHADSTFVDVNVAATERVLRAAANSAVKRFLYVSSVKAVGEA